MLGMWMWNLAICFSMYSSNGAGESIPFHSAGLKVLRLSGFKLLVSQTLIGKHIWFKFGAGLNVPVFSPLPPRFPLDFINITVTFNITVVSSNGSPFGHYTQRNAIFP